MARPENIKFNDPVARLLYETTAFVFSLSVWTLIIYPVVLRKKYIRYHVTKLCQTSYVFMNIRSHTCER